MLSGKSFNFSPSPAFQIEQRYLWYLLPQVYCDAYSTPNTMARYECVPSAGPWSKGVPWIAPLPNPKSGNKRSMIGGTGEPLLPPTGTSPSRVDQCPSLSTRNLRPHWLLTLPLHPSATLLLSGCSLILLSGRQQNGETNQSCLQVLKAVMLPQREPLLPITHPNNSCIWSVK